METEFIKQCEYCGSTKLLIKRVFKGRITICKNCLLGFNQIDDEFDYENNSDFIVKESILSR